MNNIVSLWVGYRGLETYGGNFRKVHQEIAFCHQENTWGNTLNTNFAIRFLKLPLEMKILFRALLYEVFFDVPFTVPF
jgi:hypothetical protein